MCLRRWRAPPPSPANGRGCREEDRAAICRCLASAYPVGQPVSLMSLGATLADSQVDLRAMGFSRTARLLPCLLGGYLPTRPPEGAEADQAYIRLEPSILRALPEGAQARPVPQPQPSALTREDRSAIRRCSAAALPREASSPWPPSFFC